MKLTHLVKLTPAQVAEAFCELDDDGQAQVFVHVAKIAEGWTDTNMPRGWQWHAVGRHLRTCECSTEAAREVVTAIAEGMEP